MDDVVMNYNAIARNIRVARAKMGYSQKQLAIRSGVCEATISFIENAKHKLIRISTLNKLAYVLQVDLEDLLKD